MRAVALLGGVLLAVAAVSFGSDPVAAQGPPPAAGGPTFNKDVAPIVYSKCASCHREGEVAPMALITYEQVRPWARAIKNKVIAREMPPWGADPKATLPMRNDISLSEA
jgi:hypothetical protein